MQDWEQRAYVLQEACLSIQESNEDNSSRIKGLKSIYINVLNHLKQEITGGILSPSKKILMKEILFTLLRGYKHK